MPLLRFDCRGRHGNIKKNWKTLLHKLSFQAHHWNLLTIFKKILSSEASILQPVLQKCIVYLVLNYNPEILCLTERSLLRVTVLVISLAECFGVGTRD